MLLDKSLQEINFVNGMDRHIKLGCGWSVEQKSDINHQIMKTKAFNIFFYCGTGKHIVAIAIVAIAT